MHSSLAQGRARPVGAASRMLLMIDGHDISVGSRSPVTQNYRGVGVNSVVCDPSVERRASGVMPGPYQTQRPCVFVSLRLSPLSRAGSVVAAHALGVRGVAPHVGGCRGAPRGV